jgi:flagellar L-ring protein precursor FlgH
MFRNGRQMSTLKSFWGYGLAILTLFYSAVIAHADNLYQPGQFQSLVGDYHASQPGDTLTVLIYEDAKSSASAGTTTGKNAETGLGGKAGISTGQLGAGSVGWEANEGFQSKGSIQRRNNLVAQLSVTVQSVSTNGELLVKGEQLIEINGEKQHIRIEGRVRPRDISSHNTVISSRLADAKISYIGDGILAKNQRPGWFTRILSWFGLL